MNWLWGRSDKDDEKKEEYVKRPPVSKKQRDKEETAIQFINQVNKEEQGRFVKIAKINKTLRETTEIMKKNLITVSERGADIDDIVNKSEELEFSSRDFMIRLSPWYWRWFYSIRDCVCCCFYEQGGLKKKPIQSQISEGGKGS